MYKLLEMPARLLIDCLGSVLLLLTQCDKILVNQHLTFSFNADLSTVNDDIENI